MTNSITQTEYDVLNRAAIELLKDVKFSLHIDER